ncbi:NAD(P)H-dependent oxidoreductase [Pigmentiphaga litoralis]|uniref:NAD(P)H-dependent oxidoreductase n=1 Tax=Pigmentiphaga litoralis TaxID=516702 RepID=UPI0027E56F17|nr:NAD(P)H-dependent oxidoreductase [Pigmentiphaga litoralis]
MQWYSTPPLPKEWQDAILTRMFYINYEDEARLLEGTPLIIKTTAGNLLDSYRAGGRNMFPMSELVAPLRDSASLRAGLRHALRRV